VARKRQTRLFYNRSKFVIVCKRCRECRAKYRANAIDFCKCYTSAVKKQKN